MAKLPERYAHFETRVGLVPVSTLTIRESRLALRRSLPTRWHAARLVDAVRAQLGSRAFESVGLGTDDVQIYARDSDDARLVAPMPVLRLTRGASQHDQAVATLVNSDPVLPDDAPDDWKPGDAPWRTLDPRPQLRPRGVEMCAGELTITDGPAFYTIRYDDEGVRCGGGESGTDTFTWLRHDVTSPYVVDTLSRPPSPAPISLFGHPDLVAAGIEVEQLAAMLVGLGVSKRVAWRAHVPVPIPAELGFVVQVASGALRAALFASAVPDDALWVAADGLDGRAIAWGGTIDDARAQLEREMFRVMPRPPGMAEDDASDAPQPPAERKPTQPATENGITKISLGTVHMKIEGRPLPFPWPRVIPSNIPALFVPLRPVPAVPEALHAMGFTRVARCLGQHGGVTHVFVREDPHGVTAIGEHIVDLVDADLDAELDAADAEMREMMPDDAEAQTFVESRMVFTLWDDERRVRIPAKHSASTFSAKIGPWGVDGDVAGWRVVRERRV